jgi:phosphatidate cytidylyltransferase
MAEHKPEPRWPSFGRTDDPVPGEGGNYRFLAALEQSQGWQRNLRQRLLAGVPALALVLLIIAFAPPFVVGLLVLAAGMYGLHEYLTLVEVGIGPALPYAPLMTGAGLMGLGAVWRGQQGLLAMLFVATLLAIFFVWFRGPKETPRELQHAGAALLGLILVPWFINHLTLLARLPDGRGVLGFLFLVVTLNDSAAYLVGSLFGKRLLLPEVSPKKTVEGAMAGIGGGLVAAIVSWTWLGGSGLNFGFLELLVLAVMLAAVAQMGDLLESKLKRLTRAEDSGSFLPGHGGLLDRMDSYLLAAPFFYYFLWLFYL